jgi:acyl-coenzyme A thioesterase PaaI-like protein
MKAIQLYYPPEWAHCYGCGYLNPMGLHIKTYWNKEKGESETRFTPSPHHTAIPGFVYGGLLASLVDCHSTATAAAAKAQAEGVSLEENPLRFVTASLKVDYLKPTPLGPELLLVGRAKEVKGKKVVVETELYAEGTLTVRGEAVLVQITEALPNLKRLQGADQDPQELGLGGGDEDQFQPGLLQDLLDLVQALPAPGLAQGRRL